MRAPEQHGFALVEMIVAVALMSVVFGATLTILDVFQSNNRVDQLRHENQDTVRSATDALARQLRNVISPSAKSAGALEEAGSYSITFQTVDASKGVGGENKSGAMRVRYCLDDSSPRNETLWQQVKRWTSAEAPALPSATACPDLNASDWDSSRRLLQHVTNRSGGQDRPAFVYGPPGATQVSNSITIQTNLFVELTAGQRPGETQLTSGVSLRNADRLPIAAFTATEVNGHIRLNASESTDPGGLALSYQWWIDSAKQNTTAQQWETGKLTSKSTHTFKLEVANPGGLSASTERTVTLQ
jgi:prepilin-type N-terminal cleavage/methylation domain-containing protein